MSSNPHAVIKCAFLQAGDAKAAWKALDKKEKKKWAEKLEPKRQKYIEVQMKLLKSNYLIL